VEPEDGDGIVSIVYSGRGWKEDSVAPRSIEMTAFEGTTRELRLELDTAFYGGLEQVPGYQNVASPYDKLWWSQAKLAYSNVRSSLGRVDDEKGHAWEIVGVNKIGSMITPGEILDAVSGG